MSEFVVGDMVRVLPPFNEAFPDTYEICGYSAERGVYQICEDRDFSPNYLEKAE